MGLIAERLVITEKTRLVRLCEQRGIHVLVHHGAVGTWWRCSGGELEVSECQARGE